MFFLFIFLASLSINPTAQPTQRPFTAQEQLNLYLLQSQTIFNFIQNNYQTFGDTQNQLFSQLIEVTKNTILQTNELAIFS